MKNILLIVNLLFISCVFSSAEAISNQGIIGTKHDLSSSNPAPNAYKALNETRICIFCHTPHNANPMTPLWNKNLSTKTYDLYSSTTMLAVPQQPEGPTRLCLSCHDGTLALGTVLKPEENITMSGATNLISGPSYIDNLDNHHPVSFAYSDSLPNDELAPSPPETLLFYNYEDIHCTTCHNPHDNRYSKFLAVNNENSGLCLLCHNNMAGWNTASHKNSPNVYTGPPPQNSTNPDYPWPRTGAGSDFGWTTVQMNGCENCHAPHSAGGTQRLMKYETEEQNCYACHNGNVAAAAKNIETQFMGNTSRHHVEMYTDLPPHDGINKHDPMAEGQSPFVYSAHVECVDCHNPHASDNSSATAPARSGKIAKVTGIDKSGNAVIAPNFAANEYEICFKCHADSAGSDTYDATIFIERSISTINTRVDFSESSQMNSSHHPVTDTKTNADDISSLSPPTDPVTDPEVPTGLTAMSYIYCTDCHSDDNPAVSRGPHGSQYAPILRRQYITDVGMPYNDGNFHLCYRCHNKTSIKNDVSFRKTGGMGGHSGHLQSPTDNKPMSCSVCHDPHGVQDDSVSGSHTYLINFDMSIVQPLGANPKPIYTDNGGHSGSCTLECHFPDLTVKYHDNAPYP